MEAVKNDLDKEIARQSEKEPSESPKKDSTSKIVGFWSIAIPAYCYFFGYSSLKYELESLGFDSPDIPTTPGDVYFHAFNTFAFMASKILPAAKELIIKHFDESWHLVVYISVGAAIAAYLGQFIVHRLKGRSSNPQHTKEKISINSKWRNKPFKIITASTQWSWTILSGQGKEHSLWISKALYLVAFVNICFFIVLPIFFTLIGFLTLILLPAPIIGVKMAQEELSTFSCPTNTVELPSHRECSLITLKDGKSIIGVIYNKDSKFMYLLTKDEAKTIAIDQVMQGDRKVKTGKVQNSNASTGGLITESLYCHKELAIFDSSSLLKRK